MYKNFFGLRESPFTIAPDPRYLYMSEQHREALAHLLYGITCDGGFVLLTGEVGTGKTTVCRCLLEQIPADTDVALILNPCLTGTELLASICQEFSINIPLTDSAKLLVDHINRFLLDCNQKGRKAVLVLDEAQNLSCEVLEQIRLLTNLETNTRKLLQIIMLGQPELLEKLDLPEMRQFTQRITARYHLGPLTAPEVKEYVRHRWKVAGGRGDFLDDRQINRLYTLSKGIPRVINLICDRMLLGAYGKEVKQISMAILDQAAKEVMGRPRPRKKRGYPTKASSMLWVALAVSGVILVSLFIWYKIFRNPSAFETAVGVSPGPSLTSQTSDLPTAIEPLQKTTTGNAAETSNSSSVSPSREEPVSKNAVNLPPPEPAARQKREVPSEAAEQMVWLQKRSAAPTRRSAFADLFLLWGMSFPSSEPSACHFAVESGLKCLFRRGSLDDLFEVNRPAVLEMLSDDEVQFPVTLVRLDRQNATLIVDGQARKTTPEQVALHWTGNYILLWKPPPGYAGSIKPGIEGQPANWLSKRLAEAGEKVEAARADDLAIRVKRFQIKAGLVPDGIAGVQTIIQLNSRTDKDIPRLHDDVQ